MNIYNLPLSAHIGEFFKNCVGKKSNCPPQTTALQKCDSHGFKMALKILPFLNFVFLSLTYNIPEMANFYKSFGGNQASACNM